MLSSARWIEPFKNAQCPQLSRPPALGGSAPTTPRPASAPTRCFNPAQPEPYPPQLRLALHFHTPTIPSASRSHSCFNPAQSRPYSPLFPLEPDSALINHQPPTDASLNSFLTPSTPPLDSQHSPDYNSTEHRTLTPSAQPSLLGRGVGRWTGRVVRKEIGLDCGTDHFNEAFRNAKMP